MPRQAHGRPLQNTAPAKTRKRKTARNGALTALETAERQNPDDFKVRQHRLGEIEDDSDEPQTRADVDERSSKRRKITNDMADNESEDGEGSDLEGGRWHEGVDEDDEDSDIDSDEAFGESDEERFSHFTIRGSKSQNNKDTKQARAKKPLGRIVKSVNDDDGWEGADAFNNDEDSEEETGSEPEEDDDDEDDDLGEEAVDLATALDMNEEEDRAEAERAKQKTGKKSAKLRRRRDVSSDNEDHDQDEESDQEDIESNLSISDDERQGDVRGLQEFVAGLDAQADNIGTKSRTEVRALPNKPSQFGLGAAKLSAADLLQYIKDPTQRQSLKILQASERNGPGDYKGGIPGKLAAPLAKRQQDRLDRVVAYEKSKETLNRWIDTVKQNRRAEHLSFPLQDPAMQSATSTKQLAPTSQSAPVTALEATIQEIMEESGLGSAKGQSIEEQEQAFEELQEKTIPLEEVRARRAELRKARELMFREEIRAKRIKKIKSKAYRRVHRKERERLEAREHEELAAHGLLNSDEERERSDRRRAEERMGARHRESRWAKGVKAAGKAAWDEDARAGVTDLARRDEELRRRIDGKTAVDSDASESESDADSNGSDTDEERFVEKLAALKSGNQEPGSRLASMAFMQRAENARRAENDGEIRQLQLAFSNRNEEVTEDDNEEPETTGRQVFGVSAQQQKTAAPKRGQRKNEFEAPLSEDESEGETTAPLPVKAIAKPGVAQESSLKVDKINGNTQSKPALGSTKTQSVSRSASAPSVNSKVSRPSTTASINRVQEVDDYTSPSESEDEAHTPNEADDAGGALAATIFAGPEDSIQEFAKEKKEIEEEEGDQVVDNTLPGWGSWTGVGVSKREQKKGKGRFLTTIKGVAPEKRQDARLDRVIINEKRIKKNSKYLATELPHPFETRQQYERSLRLPMGPEWSTANHFQDAIKPRVLLKQGSIIKPMAKPLV